MTKIDIFSGFLGAGKTTLIKKCLKEAFENEQIVLIENEFGEIGIDGGFLKEAGIQIKEMNSGCICCSLVGDFTEALSKVIEEYHPDRILIEPSGVGKLSDIISAVEKVKSQVDIQMNSFVTVADASKTKMYMKNFKEFFNDQIEAANVIVLSRTQKMNESQLKDVIDRIKEHNDEATIITTPWDEISGKEILNVIESKESLEKLLKEEAGICPECGHHHEKGCCHHEEEHHHEEECCCGHHHDEEAHHCDHHHSHEHSDGGCCCNHHEHHEEGCHHHHEGEHHHDEECCCGHDHHHHHHADEVFTSWGVETIHKYDEAELHEILDKLANTNEYGTILRAKGIVAPKEGKWYHFDLVPEEVEIRRNEASYTGRICVIGENLKEEELKKLFGI